MGLENIPPACVCDQSAVCMKHEQIYTKKLKNYEQETNFLDRVSGNSYRRDRFR